MGLRIHTVTLQNILIIDIGNKFIKHVQMEITLYSLKLMLYQYNNIYKSAYWKSAAVGVIYKMDIPHFCYIVLFGNCISGALKTSSDIDLLIVSEEKYTTANCVPSSLLHYTRLYLKNTLTSN